MLMFVKIMVGLAYAVSVFLVLALFACIAQ